jgi:hypothetical protein
MGASVGAYSEVGMKRTPPSVWYNGERNPNVNRTRSCCSSMANTMQWILGIAIIATCFFSALYSFRARRVADVRLRGLYASKMNISMGLMLVFISLIQMLLFTGSTLRVIIGALFFILGLFNLFAGMRNHSHFTRLEKKAD